MSEEAKSGPFTGSPNSNTISKPNQRATTLLEPASAPPAAQAVQPFYLETAARARWSLRILVLGAGAPPLRLDVVSAAIIGRPDNVESFAPEIDLAPFGARDKGVSRRHARIAVLGDELYLIDLGSTNGTRLNGARLHAHHAYRLTDGDQVECGTLRLLIGVQAGA
jgi:pSer/pThr/pTyr-binding forkhead associated (FHA) protein